MMGRSLWWSQADGPRSRRPPPSRRGSGSGARAIWLTVALGAVAFLVWRMQRRSGSSDPRRPASPALGLPWVERASVAIHLRQSGELRRIARELDALDYPAAGALLDNYALLLERSHVSRNRVLAEVTRVLATGLTARTPGVFRRTASAGTPSPPPVAWPRAADARAAR
jgi:hypothetical protein